MQIGIPSLSNVESINAYAFDFCEFIVKTNFGLNIFSLIVGILTILSFVIVFIQSRKTREFEYKCKKEESSRYYYEKRIVVYKNVKTMYRNFLDCFYKKDYEEAKRILDNDFDLVITDLLTLFEYKYCEEFQKIYDIAIRKIIHSVNNEKKYKNTQEEFKKINEILNHKPIGYVVSTPMPAEFEEIDYDLSDKICNFENSLIKFINDKSEAISK